MSGLTYAAVLITKDRRVRAERMVDQMIAQTRPPERMVIVDASTPPLELDQQYTARARQAGIDLAVVHSHPAMGAQRNHGVDLVSSPIALILDDDVLLPADYMEQVLERWDARGFDTLGGVVGAMIYKPSPRRPLMRGCERLVRRLLFLSYVDTKASGTTLRRSGKFREVPVPADDVLVPVFHNSAVAYRTDLLRRFRFNEQFTGYVYGEDLDLSHRLAREAPILHTPATWWFHESAPEGRANDEMWYRRSRQEAYFRLRLIDRSPRTLAAFALSILAEATFAGFESARQRRLAPFSRYLAGLLGTARALRRDAEDQR